MLEITVSFLGIHKWEPGIYIGFSPALLLQCVMATTVSLATKLFFIWRAPEVLLPASGEEEAKERRVQRRDLPLCWLDDTQVISHKPGRFTSLHGLLVKDV